MRRYMHLSPYTYMFIRQHIFVYLKAHIATLKLACRQLNLFTHIYTTHVRMYVFAHIYSGMCLCADKHAHALVCVYVCLQTCSYVRVFALGYRSINKGLPGFRTLRQKSILSKSNCMSLLCVFTNMLMYVLSYRSINDGLPPFRTLRQEPSALPDPDD